MSKQAQGMLPLIATWIVNAVSLIDKTTVTFLLGCGVSVLAILHYMLEIRKSLQTDTDFWKRFKRKDKKE